MVQVVTNKSWGSKIVGALFGVLIGIALIIGSFFLVFWNEGHGLRTAQALTEAQQNVISVANAPVDPNNNLRLIYLSGVATTTDTLHDSLLGASLQAIKLERKVEMYQWQEHKETKSEDHVGGSQTETTTYTYKTIWSAELIDNSEFQEQAGHQNPNRMAIESKTQYAKTVMLGDFQLPHQLVKEISGETSVDLSKLNFDELKNKLNLPIQSDGDNLYVGENPSMPKVGDLKIMLTEVSPQTVSIIAQQTGTTLQPYTAKSGQTVSLLSMGQTSPTAMILDAQSANKMLTWGLRLASAIMMIVGILLLMGPIVALADVIPFFGSIAGFGAWLIAIVCGLILWSVAVGIAWFAVRPLWSIGLIVIIVLICGFIIYRKRK